MTWISIYPKLDTINFVDKILNLVEVELQLRISKDDGRLSVQYFFCRLWNNYVLFFVIFVSYKTNFPNLKLKYYGVFHGLTAKRRNRSFKKKKRDEIGNWKKKLAVDIRYWTIKISVTDFILFYICPFRLRWNKCLRLSKSL